MKFIGNDDAGIVHQFGHVRGLSPRRSAKIEHIRIRSRCQDQGSETRGERLRVNVTEEILQQFARGQGPGGVIKGVSPETDLSQGDSFLMEHPDEGSRGSLQAVHAKVIGKRPS